MAFYVAQAGEKLYLVSPDGTLEELTLPANVTIEVARRGRFAVLNRDIVYVNAPTQTLIIRPDKTVGLLTPRPPSMPLKLAATGSGALNGIYRAKMAFGIKDKQGRILALSPYGPESAASASLVNQQLSATQCELSQDVGVNFRRIARTTAAGAVYFDWYDLDSNATTAFVDGVRDEGLATLPIPTDLGAPPVRFDLMVEWKRRLWAKSRNEYDAVVFSGDGLSYAWPVANTIPIPPFGNDTVGINGFISRRDELGIGRLDRWWKIIGDDPENFSRVVLIEGTGIEAPDSAVTIHDVGYWLAKDGVYAWDSSGVQSVSKERAHGWFSTDDYFNRALYSQAVGWWDPRFHTYNLLLCATGSTSLDRWVVYDITRQRWFGPHKTAALTPTFAGLLADSNVNYMPVLCGSNGFIYKMNQAAATDAGSAIDFDVQLRHNMKTPDIDKVLGQMSILTRVEAGGTLDVIPSLGGIAATAQATISHNLTLGRQRLRRLSTIAQATGRILKLRFRNNENEKPVHIFGYEIPFTESGRR